MKAFITKFFKFLAVAAVWLLLWQIAAAVTNREYILPYPKTVFAELFNLAIKKEFYISVFLSLFNVMSGFVAGVMAGSLLAVISALSDLLKSFLAPLSAVIKATPVASFILLFYIFFDRSLISPLISMLIVVPLVWKNVYFGIKSADSSLLEMSECFHLKRKYVVKYIYFTAIKPHFISAVLTASGLAWKAGIAAEVICSPTHTIGYYLYRAKINFNTPELFAETAVVIIISFIIEKIIEGLLKKWSCKA